MRNPFSRPVSPDPFIFGAATPNPPIRIELESRPCPSGPVEGPATRPTTARPRLADLDSHLHCSVIGTCLSTSELRKAMARFIVVDGSTDLVVHHESVRLTSQDPAVGHALNKLLDRLHDASVQQFGRIKDAEGLASLWQRALAAGEIPGAYWALLTHRRATPELVQQAFGDVHMLSHLVGSANRADVRRLVALEAENSTLRDRADRLQDSVDLLVTERDRGQAENRLLKRRIDALEREIAETARSAGTPDRHRANRDAHADAVALQTQRREAAESRAQLAETEYARLVSELEHLHDQMIGMGHELGAAEAELRRQGDSTSDAGEAASRPLSGQRLLYVGGRPSTLPAIRDIAHRQGGEFQRHDGGIEDRKGLLGPAIAWATLVVFPVDCIDHDSALTLKRACHRQGTPFIALRSGSIACFAAAIAALHRPGDDDRPGGAACVRHL